jgi:hypothetical protein
MDTWSAAQTANQDLTTATVVDLAGATVTIPVGSADDKFLVLANFDLNCAVGTNTIGRGFLNVGGTAQPVSVTVQQTAGDRSVNPGTWVVTGLTPGNVVFKLTGQNTAAAGTMRFTGVTTTITVVKLEGGGGGDGGGSVVPAYGSVGQSVTVSSTSTTPVTLYSIAIPSAGTWDITYWARAQSGVAGLSAMALYNGAGAKVVDSEVFAWYFATASTGGSSGAGRQIVVTTGPETYTVRGWSGGAYNVAWTADVNGRGGATWSQLISGGGSAPMDTWQASASSAVTCTTATYVDVPDATLTIPAASPNDKFLVLLNGDVTTAAGTGVTAATALMVDGVNRGLAPWLMAPGERMQSSQTYIITGLTAGNHVFKMQAANLSATGSISVLGTGATKITVVKLVSDSSTAGVWQDYVPATSGGVVGNSTLFGRYSRVGNTIHFTIRMDLGTGVNLAGMVFGVPAAFGAFAYGQGISSVYMQDTGVGYVGMVGRYTGIGVQPYYVGAGSALLGISNTAPYTVAVGDLVMIAGTYEAAPV